MKTELNSAETGSGWTVWRAVLWAGFPFIIGLTLGVLARRTVISPWPNTTSAPSQAPPSGETLSAPRQNSPNRLKSVADKQAEPLLAKLKSTPDDPDLLARLGNIYYVTQNFQEACTYFKRSVDIREDANVRTELGRAYFYAGDPDEALAQFEKVLKVDPDNVNAMFNLGVVKWQSKFDVDGAVAAWQQILKKHPNHPRRAEVEKLIERAREHRNMKQPE